jgi:hypothetical protein
MRNVFDQSEMRGSNPLMTGSANMRTELPERLTEGPYTGMLTLDASELGWPLDGEIGDYPEFIQAKHGKFTRAYEILRVTDESVYYANAIDRIIYGNSIGLVTIYKK